MQSTIGGAHTSAQVLVVARDRKVANELPAWLADAGHEVRVVTSFTTAKGELDRRFDLVVSEIKLGEYNGLHLALRARSIGVSAIVLGPSDPVLERDAAALGAVYVQAPPSKGQLLEHVCRLIASRGFASPLGSHHRAIGPTTTAAEVEVIWRAFIESEQDAAVLGRSMLPN